MSESTQAHSPTPPNEGGARLLIRALHSALALSFVAAFFAAPLMPLLDWPQHLLTVSIFAHAGDPVGAFSPFYAVEPRVTTYVGAWLPAALMSHILGIESALRLVTVGALVSTPLAFGRLLKSTGRSPDHALLLWPWVLSFAFWMGFIPFVCSIPIALWTLSLAIDCGRASDRRPAMWLAFALVLLFLTHSLAFLVTGCLAAAAGTVASAGQLRNLVRGGLAFLPAGALWLVWFATHYGLDPADALGASVSAIYGVDSSGSGQLGSSGESIAARIGIMWTQLTEPISDSRDDFPLMAASIAAAMSLAGAWILRLRAGQASSSEVETPTRTSGRGRSGYLTGTLLGMLMTMPALVIPFDLAGVHAVGPRFIVFLIAGLILALTPPVRVGMGVREPLTRRILSAAPPLAAAACTLWLLAGFWTVSRDVQRENQGFADIVDALPHGQRVYGLIDSPWSSFVARPPFLHAAATAVALRGGAVGFSFFNNLSVPIRIRVPGALPWAGRRAEWEPARFVEDAYGPWYDYLLVRGGPNQLHRRLQTSPDVWELVRESGQWRLFRRTEPDTRPVVMSLLERIHRASVTSTGERTPCPQGPGYRHQCPQHDWLWVGPTEQVIDRQQHPCIWAHPLAGQPISLQWTDMPAQAVSLRGWAALADTAFSGGRPSMDPVTLEFLVDGQSVGTFDSPPRRGIFPYEIQIPASPNLSDVRTLEVVVRASDDGRRHFCFTGSVLAPPNTP
jgi:hypothetical protein